MPSVASQWSHGLSFLKSFVLSFNCGECFTWSFNRVVNVWLGLFMQRVVCFGLSWGCFFIFNTLQAVALFLFPGLLFAIKRLNALHVQCHPLPGIPVGITGWPGGFSVLYLIVPFLPQNLGDACSIEGVRWGQASGLPLYYWEIPGSGIEVLGSSETLISMPVSLTPVWVMRMPNKFFLLLSYLNPFSLYLWFPVLAFFSGLTRWSDSISENTTMKILTVFCPVTWTYSAEHHPPYVSIPCLLLLGVEPGDYSSSWFFFLQIGKQPMQMPSEVATFTSALQCASKCSVATSVTGCVCWSHPIPLLLPYLGVLSAARAGLLVQQDTVISAGGWIASKRLALPQPLTAWMLAMAKSMMRHGAENK